MHKYTPLSEHTRAIILGSLLGDGSLKIHRPYKNARFSFRHSYKQAEYFHWKVAQLEEISSESSVFAQGKNGKDGFGTHKLRYQSRALPALTELYELTHKSGKFTVRRKWLNQLTPLSLAVWWFDDGSLVRNTNHGVFCTDGFTLDEVKVIDRYMKKVWGITTKIGRVAESATTQEEQYRLWIRSREDLKTFLRIILPYVPVSSMLYKVVLLYRDPLLQQRWISEVAQQSPFSLAQIEQCVQERKAALKHFR